MTDDHATHAPRHAAAALLGALALMACNGRSAFEESEIPGRAHAIAVAGEPDGAAYATTTTRKDGDEPVLIGTITMADPTGEDEDDQREPRYTSIEAMVDPTLAAACGMQKPTVYFEFDSARLQREAEQRLEEVASCLRKHPLDDDPIEVIGHADERGTDEYNRELGFDRAKMVARVLTDKGIERGRIQTYSWGESQADEPEYWDDRRVVIRLAQ